MIKRNLKVLLGALAISLPIWWMINGTSSILEEFFFLRELRTNPGIIGAYAAQHKLEQELQDAYPLLKKGAVVPELQSQSVLSIYVKKGGGEKILFEKNGDMPLPIASITKLMTALVAIQSYPSDQRVTITLEILETPGEAGQLRENDVFTVKDLLYLALMESSNDAAVALAQPMGQERFVARMNEESARMNLPDTIFTNATGLDNTTVSNVSTPADLAALTRVLLARYPQIFDILSQKELALYTPEGNFHHTMKNTNELLAQEEWPAKIFGGKTGTTPNARQTLLLVLESPDGRGYMINVILGSEARFQEMRQLLRWILDSYQWQT